MPLQSSKHNCEMLATTASNFATLLAQKMTMYTQAKRSYLIKIARLTNQ